jgi:hypothetical protein
MADILNNLGVATVVLKQFADDTLPKVFAIKARLDQGDKLDHWDIEFLTDLLKRFEQVKHEIDQHPEYQEIYAQAVHLYKQITDQAVVNEQKP